MECQYIIVIYYCEFNIHRISFRLKPLHVCRVNVMQNFYLYIFPNCGERWPHDPSTGCPARNGKCNSCHKYGHYAKFCSSKKSPGHTCNSHKGKRLRGRRNFKGKPEQEQRIHQVEPDYGQHETLSSLIRW